MDKELVVDKEVDMVGETQMLVNRERRSGRIMATERLKTLPTRPALVAKSWPQIKRPNLFCLLSHCWTLTCCWNRSRLEFGFSVDFAIGLQILTSSPPPGKQNSTLLAIRQTQRMFQITQAIMNILSLNVQRICLKSTRHWQEQSFLKNFSLFSWRRASFSEYIKLSCLIKFNARALHLISTLSTFHVQWMAPPLFVTYLVELFQEVFWCRSHTKVISKKSWIKNCPTLCVLIYLWGERAVKPLLVVWLYASKGRRLVHLDEPQILGSWISLKVEGQTIFNQLLSCLPLIHTKS